ncbi:MAG: MFS transporter [Acidobacteriota bacterium]|nr:MFS transporter [Acidobacteriota bacterium]MDQ5873174.1 MFS transporter [Acidobacteriota bacterium]
MDTNRVEVAPSGELVVRKQAPALERGSWALYDFANTIFSMNIATLYFPVWIVVERGATATALSLATSAASVVVLFAAPLLGARSDVSRRRKPWVIGLTLACVAATALLAPIARARLHPSTVLLLLLTAYAIANLAYQLALPFYNAMMPELVPPERHGRLSGLGTALGYVGSIAGVMLVAPLVSGKWSLGGPAGREAAFLPTAALFLLFSLPLFLFCHDHVPRSRAERPTVRFREIAARIAEAFRDARKYPGLRRFLFASYLYQDALGTAIAFMAIYAVKVLGLAKGEEAKLFAALTVPAVIGSYLAGLASDRLGPRRTLVLVLWGWVAGLLAIALAPTLGAFWAAGALLGFVFGGIWSVERPLLLTLVPDSEAGRFFGLLVLSARAAAIAGPILWALVAEHLFRPFGEGVGYRAAVASLVLFILGAIALLRRVPDAPLRSSRSTA